MSRYTYLAVDFRSGTVLEELPLTGVSASLKLNSPGPFRGKLDLLKQPSHLRAPYMAATIPGRTVVYVLRDGSLMGGWLIRKRGGDMHVLDLVGESLVGWLSDVVTSGGTQDWARYQEKDQTWIAWRLVMTHFWEITNPPIKTRDPQYSGRLITTGYDDWQLKPTLEAMTDMAEAPDGFDFDILPEFDADGNIHNYFHTWYPSRGNRDTLHLDWADDTAGQDVLSADWPEDASGHATEVFAVGAGEGDSRLIAHKYNIGLWRAGWPNKTEVVSYSDVEDMVTLDALAQSALDLASGPKVTPRLTISADTTPPLGAYWPGDWVRFRATSPRFPRRPNGGPGLDVDLRITDVTFNPPSAGWETVSITLADIVTDRSAPVGVLSAEDSGGEQPPG